MAKRRGLLKHAARAVKKQRRTGAPGTPSTARPPPAKKQKTGPSSSKADKKTKPNGPQQQNQKPTIPFSPTDPILLVGEGDLSFAASLVTHHKCTNVTATVLEKDLAELAAKYPHVSSNIAQIEQSPGCRLLYGVDARRLPAFTTKPKKAPSQSPGPAGAMKRIIFNFPHTGGRSTDVNRQVRHNQELLVAFFGGAQRALAPGGAVVVTLFEGEPYTLWNVRDLARHAGLQVATSFRFAPAAYPGYGHARTLGVVRNRRGEVAASAWKGEDRPARSYVFVRKGEEWEDGRKKKGGKKRRRGGESDESESESESESEDGEDQGQVGYGGEGEGGEEELDDAESEEETENEEPGHIDKAGKEKREAKNGPGDSDESSEEG